MRGELKAEQRVFAVFALAILLFVALTVTGTSPFGTTQAGATQYCVQYQYSTCGPLVGPLIAFASTRDGNVEIYVMNSDGSSQTRLWANTNRTDEMPSWSPDGAKIAFASGRDGPQSEIYTMTVDASAQTRLTSNAFLDTTPAWSPSGSRIAFVSNRDGNYEIYSMNVNGSGQTRLTNNAAQDYWPAWSPDGTKIAFASLRDGNNEIYVMNADGSGQTRLTNTADPDVTPAWSPDGTKIVFASYRDGNAEIYAMNANGTSQTRLTNNAVSDFDPAWSPDGSKVAFTSTRENNTDIYVMNANGSGQTRLTIVAGVDADPSWQLTKPAAPTVLIATGLSRSSIGLTWTDNASNETGFRIERSPTGTTGWKQIATVDAGVTAYTHKRQPAATIGFYRVRATNGAGDSGYSNIATGTTLAKPAQRQPNTSATEPTPGSGAVAPAPADGSTSASTEERKPPDEAAGVTSAETPADPSDVRAGSDVPPATALQQP